MSKEWIGEKRCIVKTLNFEECVPTNLKTKGKGLKRLRATFSREIKDPSSSFETEKKRKFSESQIIEESPDTLSPVLTEKCGRSNTSKCSPVLAKKKLVMPKSPVFLSKRKLFSGTVVQRDSKNLTPDQIRSETIKTSPVFKLKRPPVKRCLDLFSAYDAVKVPSQTLATETIDDDTEEESCRSQIERSSSQETQESDEIKIESCGESQESESGNLSDISDCTSESQSETILKNPRAVELKTPVKVDKEAEKTNLNLDSGKKKTRFVKNSLSERLYKLKKSQLSERRIWEHEREIMKIDRKIKEKFLVVSFWQDENFFTIKCRTLNEAGENLIMIIDGDIVPNVHKIKENSILSISPPWQKLYLPKLKSNVILSVVCVEVKTELATPASHDEVSELMDLEKWRNDDSLLINCLFSLPD